MSKKILIVGGVAGGASVAARVRRLDEHANIIIFEKGPNVSFSNCSIPFTLSGIVPTSEDLILMDPEVFKSQYNIEARVNQEVLSIDRKAKTIKVQNLLNGEIYEENYDKLVLSPGANPILPRSIEGIGSDHVFSVRNVQDIERIQNYINMHQVKEVAVVGAGFIGMEVAENLTEAGKKVHVIEAIDQVMAPFDYDMAQIIHKEMHDHGIDVQLKDGVARIEQDKIVLASGKEVPAEMVIMAIGVAPETTLARDAGLDIGVTGAIKVNRNYQTKDPDIYAVGDAIEVYHQLMKQPSKLALAGPAQRQARAAADHIYGKPHKNTGVIGSSSIKVFTLTAASTGLNEKNCQRMNIQYDFVYIIPGDKVGLMPDANPLHFKLIFEVPTGKILGAQAIGKGAADKRIDVIAAMITMGATLDDLKELELSYSPMYGTAKDVVNHAALVASNILEGEYTQVRVTEVRNLVEQDAFIIDAREEEEYELGHLKNAVNIPMSTFRNRLDEIPKDRPVYVHCRSSQRSYNVVRALLQLGFDNVVNISGSFLGICCYEYFNDQIEGREPIVTAYNFE